MQSTEAPSGEAAAKRRRGRTAFLVVALVVAGGLARQIAVDGSDSVFLRWLPWLDRESVTFFFADTEADYLVPVTRRLPRDELAPEELMQVLLSGPDPNSGLINPIPAGTAVRSMSLVDGQLVADLTGSLPPLASESVIQSMRSWPGVDDVSLSVDGATLLPNPSGHLLYFYDEARDMLVAYPTEAARPGEVLEAWMAGPANPTQLGLPPDIEVVGVELASNELLTLRFTFRQSLRTFALTHPVSVRRVLEGLIATFNTGFPEVGAVWLDFEGRNALGLGQCANLLNSAQVMPDTLNDERVLSRYVEG